MNREKMLKLVEDPKKIWDVLIVGGGASGLGIAVDAASRGYQVLLIEQSDFGKGASSKSTKLVHGGIRYLKKGDILLVLEALKERGILNSNAPHLVRNLSFVIPSYSLRKKLFYGIGLKIYDMMAGKSSFGSSRILSKEKTLSLIPNIERHKLKGGVMYHDGQFDDARLAISLAQTAAKHGAGLINYMTLTGFIKTNHQISGIHCTDELTQKKYKLNAKVVINATGVFSDDIMRMDNHENEKIIAPAQGIHLVLDSSFHKSNHAMMIPHTTDGRVLFAIPWNQTVIVGTTDTLIPEKTLEPKPLQKEIDFILENAKRYMTKKPKRNDIKSIFAGLRPLAAKGGNKKSTKDVSRTHKVLVSKTGLVSIIGGKWTTYRKMAKDTLDTALPIGGLPKRKCVTENLKIYGFKKDVDWEDGLYFYGTDKEKIQAIPNYSETLSPDLPLCKGQILWAIREEMAQTVEDVLSRRTRCLLLNAKAAETVSLKVAQIMADEMKKDKLWINKQVSNFKEVAKSYQL